MKKVLILLMLVASNLTGIAQSFAGYNSGNYAGVNSVFFNPANVVDSRYRWDVNLIGVNGWAGTTGTTFSLNNIGSAFKGDIDSVLFGNSGNTVSALANIDILGPSLLFNVGKKTSVALTSRVRALANIQDIDGKLVQSLDDKLNGSYPITLGSNADQRIKVNAWADFGLTLGQVLYNQNKHFLKAGLTVKYLAGVANTHVVIGSFNGTAYKDLLDETYISNATGKVDIGISGVDVDNFDAGDLLKFKSTGIGTDIGFVYEYRPDNTIRYKVKAGISLLDIGTIKYTPDAARSGAYTVDISGAEKWYPKELEDSSVSGVKNYLDNHTAFFTKDGVTPGSFKASLPTSLLLNVDYNIFKGFYAALTAHLNAAKETDRYSAFYHNSVTLTPRYEGRAFGLYVPLNYNELTKMNAGLSIRLGPLYLGSGSIITALFGNSKQADVFAGIKLAGALRHRRQYDENFTFGTAKTVVKKTTDSVAKTTVPVKNLVEIKVLDTDGDGIVDSLDKCPLVSGLTRYDGCPVPDTDGDGVNDEMDSCKTVAGFAKYHGCPIPDTDGDGINDEADKCPAVAGIAKYGGCPVPDTDGDGVNDEQDSCINQPGSPKYHGCPVPDSDGDGVNDDDDKCPNLAGPKDNFGCPPIPKGKPVSAAIQKKIAVAAKSIQFQTGKSVILKKSFVSLNNVVQILKTNPSYKLSVEGHTDNVGTDEKNMALSAARANAVKDYFIKKGITENRITAQGFGATKPIAPNTTAAGRTKNRRVVFTITN